MPDQQPEAEQPEGRPSREQQPQLVRRTSEDGHVYIEKIRRGMIFMANVLPAEAKGHEQTHSVPSPWLIMSARPIHRLKLVQAVPLTSQLRHDIPDFRQHRIRIREDQILRYDVPQMSGFREGTDSLALVEQVRVLSHDRLLENPVARVPTEVILYVEAALRFVFGMDAVAKE